MAKDNNNNHNHNEKRQSLGRRVSFADTATIRLFELPLQNTTGNTTKPESSSAATGENLSPNEIFALSPLKEQELVQVLDANDGKSPLGAKNASQSSKELAAEEGELLSSEGEENGIQQMEMTACVGAILKQEDAHMQIDHQSCEVLVQNEDHEMEMTTCVGKILVQNEDHEMEMTTCVGKILGQNEDHEMEMTTCVGQIMQQQTADSIGSIVEHEMEMTTCVGQIIQKQQEVTIETVQTMHQEMERTICVGKITEQTASEMANSPEKEMEMTTCVGEMLTCFAEDASTSINQSEGMLLSASLRPVDESILAEIDNVENQTFDELIDSERFKERPQQQEPMEFTQAVGQLISNDSFEIPSFLYQMDSENSFVAQQDEEQSMADVQQFSEQNVQNSLLFTSSFPVKAQCESLESDLSVKESDAVCQQIVIEGGTHFQQSSALENGSSVVKTSSTENSSFVVKNPSDNSVPAPKNASDNSLPLQVPEVSTSNNTTPKQEQVPLILDTLANIKHSFPIPPESQQKENSFTYVFDDSLTIATASSAIASSTTSTPNSQSTGEPRANLKEFLEKIDVRFLDNIKSKARRETIARNIKMEGMNLASQSFTKSALLPQLENLEKACAYLESHMEKKRLMIAHTERLFNANPPKFYLDFDKNKEHSLSLIKSFKSTARASAKQEWRRFRLALSNDIHQRLASECLRAKAIEEKIDRISALLSKQIEETSSLLPTLQQEFSTLQEKDSKFSNYDANIDKINAITAELHLISIKKAQLEQDLVKLSASRQSLQEEYSYEVRKGSTIQLCIEQSKGLLQQHKIIDDAVINQERGKLNLLCKLFGFTPIRIKKEVVEIALLTGFSIIFSIGPEGELKDISTECNKDKAKLLVLILKNRIFNGKKTTYYLNEEFERIGLLCCRYNKMLSGPITQLQCKYVIEPDYDRLCFVVKKRTGEKIVLFFDEPLTQIANLNKI